MRKCLVPGMGLLMLLAAPAAAQPFTFTLVPTDLPALDYGALAYADLDRDGDFDLVAGGNTSQLQPFQPTAYVARNAGVQQVGAGFQQTFERTGLPTGVWSSDVAWADYDGDGDLDFALTGTTRPSAPFEAVALLYENDGAGRFTPRDAGLAGVYGGAVAWGDYDNDGDADLLVAGADPTGGFVTRLYRNDGQGAFADAEAPLPDLAFGDAAWGDYDNDGDLDLLLCGADPTGGFVTRLYRNDGQGAFADTGAGFSGLAFSALDWGDYDNDGDLDVVLTGARLSLPRFMDGVAEVYRNDQGRFTRLDAGFEGILYGSASWGDYDNDGDLDLLILGATDVQSGRTGRIYRNEGGTFVARIALMGVAATAVAWGDFDGDADLDVLASGTTLSFTPLTRLYRNGQRLLNTPPEAPPGLQASVQGDAVELAWQRAFDEQTDAPGLTYNLRVGTAPGAANVVAPLASSETGRRWVPARGNVDHNTRWVLRGLPTGTYYWSVQTLDQSFIGSAFADEGSFTVSASAGVSTGAEDDADLPAHFALHPTYPNPFRDATTIAYDLPEPAAVRLSVYNVLGAEVGRLVDQGQAAGRRQVVWDGRDAQGRRVGAGVYLVRLQAGGATHTRKVVVLH